MSSVVKNVGPHADSLPNGRLVPPGVVARGIDIADPAMVAKLASGRFIAIGEDFDVVGSTVADVLAWVGDDAERAAVALAAETARPDSARATLTGKLDELVGATDDSPQED